MKRLFCGLLAVAIVGLCSGCSQKITGMGTATGRLGGLTSVNTLTEDLQEGYGIFSVNLLKQLYKNGEDVFVSPASLYIALGMTANGMEGNTLAQTLTTMGISDADTLNADCRDLQSLLSGNKNSYFKLSNAIWFKDSHQEIIKDDFLRRNEEYFGALIAAVPFDDTLFPTINKWAEQNTDGMIKNLLEPPLDEGAFMFLANALLFDGKWEMKFKAGDTKDGTFHAENGDITLPMMHRTDEKNATWYEDEAVQATLLDYEDDRTTMLVVLPKDNLNSVMTNMTADTMSGWLSGMTSCSELTLTLPRFSLTYKEELSDVLKAMGITDAFYRNVADFSRMYDYSKSDGRCWINSVIHQTALEVDESGTRAAAVTIVEMKNDCAAADAYTVKVDRPFFCAIVDKPTGAVLFEGAINNPQVIE